MTPIVWDGRPITRPGLYSGIPIERYHASGICDGPSVSSSGLRKIFNESAAHFWDVCSSNPDRGPESDNAAFILGRAAHHLFCGQPNFAKLFSERPEEINGKRWNGNNPDCKKWADAQTKIGKTILTPDQMSSIVGMAKAFGDHPLGRAGILNGLVECSLFWRDEETGVWLRARPDVIPNDSGDVVDLKTTQSVQYQDMQKSIAEFSYHQQGALIGEGFRIVLGMPMSSFSLIFIEKKRPHCVRIVTLKDGDLQRGNSQNHDAIRTFVKCWNARHWPGPGGDQSDAQYIELPEWAQKRIDDQLKYGPLT